MIVVDLIVMAVSAAGFAMGALAFTRKAQPGLRGEKGEPGITGRDGTDGAPGSTGLQGERGDAGSPGADGVAGRDGQDGRPGTDGRDGRNGSDGKSASQLAPPSYSGQNSPFSSVSAGVSSGELRPAVRRN